MTEKETISLIFSSAKELGLEPEVLTDYGLIAINPNGQERYVFYGTSVLNSQLASHLATNKHATRIILERHNLPNIPYCLPASESESLKFLKKHGKIIAKPTMGRRSRGIRLIEHPVDFKKVNLRTHILEKYIEGHQMRYLVLQNEVIGVHQKVYRAAISRPKQTKRISYAKSKWDKEMVRLSLLAVRALGLNFAAVDFMIDDKARVYILEINQSPSLLRFNFPDEGPPVDLVKILLEATVNAWRNK